MISAVLLLLAAAPDQAVREPTPITDPATWFSPDDYPLSAKRANEEGTVRFALDVSASGAITACRIVESSGFPDLDRQTCESAMLRARFKPATDAHGQPTAGTFERPITWETAADMPTDSPPDPLAAWGMGTMIGSAAADVAVDAEGRVTECRASDGATVSVDPCRALSAGQKIVPPIIRDGKKVPATIRAVVLIGIGNEETAAAP